MHPISSVYVWDGKVEDDSEIAMFVKTTSDKFDEINAMVKSLHSYDMPCVISWEIKGDGDYLDWCRGVCIKVIGTCVTLSKKCDYALTFYTDFLLSKHERFFRENREYRNYIFYELYDNVYLFKY